MVNKLEPDSAGEHCLCRRRPGPSVGAGASLCSARTLKTDPRGRDAEELWYQNSSFLYQPCVFLWWRVSRSTFLGRECIKFVGEKQKNLLPFSMGFSLICSGGHTVDRGWSHPGLSQSNYKWGHFSLFADIAWVPRLFYLQITVKSTLRLQGNCLGNFSQDFSSEVKPLENLPEIAAWNKVCAQ